MDPIVFPDAVELVVAHLDGILDVPVRSRVPNPRPASFVTVRRGGGTRNTIVTDAPQLLFECWALTDDAAMDLAQLTRAHVNVLPGQVIDGTPVYRADELGGPVNLPDPISDQARVVFTTQIHVRGVTAVGS